MWWKVRNSFVSNSGKIDVLGEMLKNRSQLRQKKTKDNWKLESPLSSAGNERKVSTEIWEFFKLVSTKNYKKFFFSFKNV